MASRRSGGHALSLAEVKASIGQRVKLARHMGALTQRELGQRLGVSRTMVWKYEHGLSFPSTEVLHRIGQEVGVPLEFFFRPGPLLPIVIEHVYRGMKGYD